MPLLLGFSPIARAQVLGIIVTGGASQQLLQSRIVIDNVEIGMAHSFIGSEAFLAEVSDTADYKTKIKLVTHLVVVS